MEWALVELCVCSQEHECMGSQAWSYTPEIPTLGRLKQEDKEFEANLAYTQRLPPEKNKMEKIRKGMACVRATFSCILGV